MGMNVYITPDRTPTKDQKNTYSKSSIVSQGTPQVQLEWYEGGVTYSMGCNPCIPENPTPGEVHPWNSW